MASLFGNQPAQSSRFCGISQLVQRFFYHCIPRSMLSSPDFFIGCPSPVVQAGFTCPPEKPSNRKTLLRPNRKVGIDSKCRFVAIYFF